MRSHLSASREWRARLAEGQAPFATIVSCSDSRVPAEIVFDQGLGDLFIVRNAGNAIGPVSLASIEFAVAKLGTRLVVVLAHERWQRSFAGDRQVAGRAVSIDGAPYTVIGVMPPDRGYPRDAEVWVPLTAASAARASGTRICGVGRSSCRSATTATAPFATAIAAQSCPSTPEPWTQK